MAAARLNPSTLNKTHNSRSEESIMWISFVKDIYKPFRAPSQFGGEKGEADKTFPELIEFFRERLKWDGPKDRK
jgi:hypothetical protein